jgi:hypothetical protein
MWSFVARRRKLFAWRVGRVVAVCFCFGVIGLAGVAGRAEEQHSVMTVLQSTTLTGYVDTSTSWWVGRSISEGEGVRQTVVVFDTGGFVAPVGPYFGPGGTAEGVQAVPEASSLALLGVGVLGIFLGRVRRVDSDEGSMN